MHHLTISERCSILLEKYLKHCGPFPHVLLQENETMEAYLEVANAIKTEKGADEKLSPQENVGEPPSDLIRPTIRPRGQGFQPENPKL